MHLLLFAVVCSVLVSVLLKLAPRLRIDLFQAITWNYAAASVLALALLTPSFASLHAASTPWVALLGLAIALPSIFLVLARSVHLAGIVRTDVAQRLSLLLSLAAAFTVFGERAGPWKFAGLAVGLLAIVCIVHRPRASGALQPAGDAGAPARAWPWLLAVWAGFAVIDVLLKTIALSGTPSLTALTLCFAIAFALMLCVQILRMRRGHRLHTPSIAAGLLLGALNFGNILFYVRAHQSLPDSPATVFATMNIGVVALGAVVGILAFGERTTRWTRIGLALAVLAIALIAWGSR
ncbi:EamA/RhaT family transporter [Xanthomonas melonis]|uniref:EamA/RhaT family transporter n=1 Tax=Xanthomonas melonis TaxID=56456 RepID=UPI001E3AF9B3|nr:EamA/RhaT family transporter [Xanthomonas melonis]MCD0279742.1 EamA/RhaT family transporter [Xanthomonas melonis]